MTPRATHRLRRWLASPRRSASIGSASARPRRATRRWNAWAAPATWRNRGRESPLPRLYREAPLNSIWEGSGNIQCLDVLRAPAREPETRDAYFAELIAARGTHPALDAATKLLDRDAIEARSRNLVERMAVALQASILLRAGNADVAESFCASRLDGEHGPALGTLSAGAPLSALIERSERLAR